MWLYGGTIVFLIYRIVVLPLQAVSPVSSLHRHFHRWPPLGISVAVVAAGGVTASYHLVQLTAT